MGMQKVDLTVDRSGLWKAVLTVDYWAYQKAAKKVYKMVAW